MNPERPIFKNQSNLSACSLPLPEKGPLRLSMETQWRPLPMGNEAAADARSKLLRYSTYGKMLEMLVDPKDRGNALMEVALCHFILGDLEQGAIYTRETVRTFSQLGQVFYCLEVLVRAARYHIHAKEFEKGAEFYEWALKLTEGTPLLPREGRLNISITIAEILRHYTHHERALVHLQEALRLARLGERNETIQPLSYLMDSHYRLGRFAEIIPYAKEIIPIATSLQMTQELEAARLMLSVAYQETGRNEESAQQEELILEAARKTHPPKAILAEWLLRTGDAWMRTGRYDKAQRYLEEALPLFEEIGNQGIAELVSQNLGTTYLLQKNHERALGFFRKATASGGREQRISANLGIGECLEHLKRYDEADVALTEGLKLARAASAKERIADYLFRLGELKLHTDLKAALVYYEEWLDKHFDPAQETTGFYIIQRVAILQMSQKRLDDALNNFTRLYEIADRHDDPALRGIALLHRGQVAFIAREFEFGEKLLKQAQVLLTRAGRQDLVNQIENDLSIVSGMSRVGGMNPAWQRGQA